jgi:hypothetical protein
MARRREASLSKTITQTILHDHSDISSNMKVRDPATFVLCGIVTKIFKCVLAALSVFVAAALAQER